MDEQKRVRDMYMYETKEGSDGLIHPVDKINTLSDLDLLLSKQRAFGEKFCDFGNLDEAGKVKWTTEFLACLSNELEELRRELPWKHWKKYDNFKVDINKVSYEIIDLLHFWLSLCLVWGLDAKYIVNLYLNKNKVNHERQQDGY